MPVNSSSIGGQVTCHCDFENVSPIGNESLIRSVISQVYRSVECLLGQVFDR
jgi:hypothetical protein